MAEFRFTIAIERHRGGGRIEGTRITAKTALGHGTTKRLVKGFLHARQLNAVLRALRAGHAGGHRAEVEREVHRVIHLTLLRQAKQPLGAIIVFKRLTMLVRATGGSQIIDRLLVDGEVAHRRAVLGRHVGDGGSVHHRQHLRARPVKLHELADHLRRAQHLGDGQHQVGRRDALVQSARELHAHHIRREKIHRLAQHACLGLNAAHAPADHAKAVDHRGMRVGADQGVRVVHSVFL